MTMINIVIVNSSFDDILDFTATAVGNICSPSTMQVTLIGHTAADVVRTDSGETLAGGGGVYYSSLALSSLVRMGAAPPVTCTVITNGPIDLYNSLFAEKFGEAGVAVNLLPSTTQTVFDNRLSDPSDPDSRVQIVRQLAEPFTITDVNNMMYSQAILLNPLSGQEIPIDLLPYLRTHCDILVADIQGWLRQLDPNGVVYLERSEPFIGALGYIDVLKVDSNELGIVHGTPLSVPDEFWPAIEELTVHLRPGGILICTHSDGVRLCRRNGDEYEQATSYFGTYDPVNRTGRGDTVTAGVIAGLLNGDNLQRCADCGASAGTAKMQYKGPLTDNDISRSFF